MCSGDGGGEVMNGGVKILRTISWLCRLQLSDPR